MYTGLYVGGYTVLSLEPMPREAGEGPSGTPFTDAKCGQ